MNAKSPTIAKLLPGTTTVTTLARYYSLHAYLATVAEDRSLSWDEPPWV